MNRRSIPEYAMNQTGPEHLRERGILAMPFMESVRDDPRRLRPHFHEFYQMYLLKGSAVVMRDFEEFAVRGVTAAFISPGQVHTVRPGRGLRGITVSFTQAFYDDEAPPPSHLLELPFFFAERAVASVRVRGAEAERITADFDQLCTEYTTAKADAEMMLRALLRLLLLRLSRLAMQEKDGNSPVMPTRAETITRQFHAHLEKHFREDLTLPRYAALLGVTANHLNDVIQEQTGHSAGDLVRRRRLLDAKRQLLHSELSVAEIGHALGFEDPSYFTKFFRRYEGQSPTEFREQIREKYH